MPSGTIGGAASGPWSGTTRALIVLNLALVVVLAAVLLAPTATAQRALGQRARGDYTMVGGRITGGNAHAIYIVDSVNQDMIAVRWNQSARTLDGIGYRDLAADARTPGGVR